MTQAARASGAVRPGESVIDDSNFARYIQPHVDAAGETKAKGLIPRNYSTHPTGFSKSAPPFKSVSIPLIPRSEWPERLKDQIAQEARLSDLRLRAVNGQRIPSLDQNGQGYCWMYSTTMAMILARARMNQPYIRFSPHAGACKVKNFVDEGGWCGLSMEFVTEHGIPSEEFWPQKSMSRSHDNAATWENAKKYRVTEGWVDLDAAVYDRNLTFDQTGSLLLTATPVVGDFNHWGHSVCLMDLVEVDPSKDLLDPARWGVRLLNSWADAWEDRGMAVLAGRKAIPDGAISPRATLAA